MAERGLLLFVAGIIILLLLSGFFSGSETAFFSLTPLDLEKMSQRKAARYVKILLRAPRRLLITLLMGNMVVNVALSSIMAALFSHLWGNRGAGMAIGLSTFLLLIFGEVTPKSLAVLHAARFAQLAGKSIYFLSICITPIRFIFRNVSGAILFVLGQSNPDTERKLKKEELETQVNLSVDEGVLAEYERKIVQHIFELANVQAKKIMIPRTEMHCVSDEMRVDEAICQAIQWRHTRVPIYHREVDEIYAVLHLKEGVVWQDFGEKCSTLREWIQEQERSWSAGERWLVREVLFEPESKGTGALFRKMKETRQHMAILLDEFGGVSGMITLADILSEIAGTGDGVEHAVVSERDRVVLSGRMSVSKANKMFGLNMDEEEADTVGGYISAILGHFPAQGESASDRGLVFTVLEARNQRVFRVEVRRET